MPSDSIWHPQALIFDYWVLFNLSLYLGQSDCFWYKFLKSIALLENIVVPDQITAAGIPYRDKHSLELI